MHASQFLIAAVTTVSGRPEPATGVVVATGLILVFSVLLILFLLITIQGKIFSAIDNKKNGGNTPKAPKAEKPAVKIETKAAPVSSSAPMQIQAGISGEVVAAIAAAVACLDGGKYTVKSVKRAVRTGRSSWGQAGVVSFTEPF